MWDPAPGEEVTNIESQHMVKGEGEKEAVLKTTEDPVITAKDESPRSGEATATEGIVSDAVAGSGNSTEASTAAPATESPAPEGSTVEPVPVETPGEAASPLTTQESANETSREPTLDTEATETTTSETDKSREPTMTTADDTSATEMSREPTNVAESSTESEDVSKVASPAPTADDAKISENDTSRETTMEQTETGKSITDKVAGDSAPAET